MIDPKEHIKTGFSDLLLEAEEFIVDKKMTPDEVINIFAEGFGEWHDYYQSCAAVYERMFDALSSRFRNK